MPAQSVRRAKRATVAVACLGTAMLMLDVAVVNTALPHMGADLHAGLGALKWVIDAYALALATTVLTVGSLADRFGRRAVFALGLVVFTGASLGCAAAQSVAVLDAARVIQGLGASALFASSLALIAHAFPDARERAGAMAMYGATIGASFAIGPLVGGALTTGLSWRWIFLVNLPIGVAALAVTLRDVAESRDPAARRIDLPGQATLTAGLFLLVLALLRGNDDHWSSARTIGEFAGAAALLCTFLLVERRSREPMLPLSLFRIRAFTGAQVSAFAISVTFFAGYLYATLYLQDVLGLSAIDAGLAYLPMTVTMLVVSGATAQLGERIPPRAMIGGGLALVAAGMALMTIVDAHSSWLAIQPGELVAGVGTGLFNPAMSSVALGSAPARMSGLAAGVNDTARQTGVAVGIAALGALIPVHAIHLHSTTYVHDLRVAFLTAAAVATAGALAAWWLIRSRPVVVTVAGEPALAETS
jgi:EmrB/QacA subfamily drug resistance transporter